MKIETVCSAGRRVSSIAISMQPTTEVNNQIQPSVRSFGRATRDLMLEKSRCSVCIVERLLTAMSSINLLSSSLLLPHPSSCWLVCSRSFSRGLLWSAFSLCGWVGRAGDMLKYDGIYSNSSATFTRVAHSLCVMQQPLERLRRSIINAVIEITYCLESHNRAISA